MDANPLLAAYRTLSTDGERQDRPGGGPAGGGAAQPDDALVLAGGPARRMRLSRPATAALLAGLIITAALVVISLELYNHNERRLLNLRVRELALVLTATAPSTQTPLASAAELATATAGSPGSFRAFMAPLVGHGRQFASASLWPVGAAHPTPIVNVGAAPALLSRPAEARQLFSLSRRSGVLHLIGMLASKYPALGFEFTAPGPRPKFAVYAENPLPASRRSAIEKNSAFSDLDYVLYLGRSRRASNLLVTNVRQLPIRGRQASDVVPFGDGVFTLVVAARVSLGGTFFEDLPWIIAGFGLLITLAAALVSERLAQGRQRAEQLVGVLDRLATENRENYKAQRNISQTLQHALLPDELPQVEGLEVSALYVAAGSGLEVGGDWYDVVAVDDRRLLLIIGDVSGHGLRAATTMALLRHAALAYVAEDFSPASVLARLSDFVQRGATDNFATMLCVLIDADAHRLTVASAGHLAPLLIYDDGGGFIESSTGAALGIPSRSNSPYSETTVTAPDGATLIAFTDGLVERRGELIDIGLLRLRAVATGQRMSLSDLLAKIVNELHSKGHYDDTAIVGIKWQS